jgi:hypothetical protein
VVAVTVCEGVHVNGAAEVAEGVVGFVVEAGLQETAAEVAEVAGWFGLDLAAERMLTGLSFRRCVRGAL